MLVLTSSARSQAGRVLRGEDLFAIQDVGDGVWAPDGNLVAVQFLSSDRRLDWNVPTADVRVLDVRNTSWRNVAMRHGPYVGFFGVAWSPSGERLVALSVDSSAVVRPWIWTRRTGSLTMVRGIQVGDAMDDPPLALWQDERHLILIARDSTAPNDGELYAEIEAYRKSADRWRTAYEGARPSVAAMESGAAAAPVASRRLVSVDIVSGAVRVIAAGDLHAPSLSADRGRLSFVRRRFPLGVQIDTGLLGNGDADADYLAAAWGDEKHTVDLRTGGEVSPTAEPPAPDDEQELPPPRPDARRVAASPNREAALDVSTSDTDGTRLWLTRRLAAPRLVWHANDWVRGIRAGHSESIAYGDASAHLVGWVIFPPRHGAGERLPAVTIIYPGEVFTEQRPRDAALLYREFENAQLLAASGYVVILPSIPYPDKPMQGDMIQPLLAGVMPMLDTVIARGIVDPRRIAILGQSAGGYSVQAMITQTDRFRSAISTAGYSDLISLYGTFYGQFRHGDAGDPQISTLMRMMQFERGVDRAGAPPWAALDRYIANSPIFKVEHVHTPIMLVQGDQDFIPVQQSEEFFTALYRQNKRAEFVRYYGEGHTLSRRANVMDFWRRVDAWLRETMK